MLNAARTGSSPGNHETYPSLARPAVFARFLPWLCVTAAFAADGIDGANPVAPPSFYAIDFVATAAFGSDMNDAGDVIGTGYIDTGCGSNCLPPLETVVWRDGVRTVLPSVPGLSGITVRSINSDGWITGFAGFPNTTTHAVVWKPQGETYAAIDLGTLPGTTISDAVGIDDLGRVVGTSVTANFPPTGSPFVWTESAGMVDLTAQGFPDETPLAISPGGAVATAFTWYRLGDPGSVVLMPPAPQSFMIGSYATAINDAGEQARFLVSTQSENLVYLFRFHEDATWQMLSPTGTGHLSAYGIGSITAAADVSATVASTAVIAYGPGGSAQPLAGLLSPAYRSGDSGDVVEGGPVNAAGQILARVMIGRSPRLVRLVPAEPCVSRCIRVQALQVRGRFIPDPRDPGHCTPAARNAVRARAVVASENGVRLEGVSISGRFLDDYWTDQPMTAVSNAQGIATFSYSGPACVGAVAFFIDNATKGIRTLDRTVGVLAGDVIPTQTAPGDDPIDATDRTFDR